MKCHMEEPQTVCVQMNHAQGNDNTHERARHINKFQPVYPIEHRRATQNIVMILASNFYHIHLEARLCCGNCMAINVVQLSLSLFVSNIFTANINDVPLQKSIIQNNIEKVAIVLPLITVIGC